MSTPSSSTSLLSNYVPSTNPSSTGKRSRAPWELNGLSSVALEQMVGSGTFGLVFKAAERETGEIVALKKIKIEPNSSQGFPVTAIREIKILKSLKHENVVALREIIVYKAEDDNNEEKRDDVFAAGELVVGDVFMVFEYCFSDLSGLLKTKEVEITEGHVKCYMKQLLNGLHYLSLKKILHRDIKSANILVTRNNVIKIADWGLARFYMDTTRQDFTNPVVTLWYRSPELLFGCKRYGTEVDIWSIGCVFCELKERVAPLRADNENDQLQKIFDLCGYPTSTLKETYEKYPDWEKYAGIATPAHQNVVPRLRQRYSHFGENDLILLEKLLDIDPAKRIKASDALDANYFWQDRTPAPHELKSFDSLQTESITEHLVHKKQREDAQRSKEAEKAMMEKKREDAMLRRQEVGSGRGRGADRAPARLDGRGGRFGRGGLPASTKYKVLDAANPPDKKV